MRREEPGESILNDADESWKSAIQALTRLSSIPLASLDLPDNFAPPETILCETGHFASSSLGCAIAGSVRKG